MALDHVASPLVIGIAGFGTVGSGLVRILQENRPEILSRAGRDIRVKAVLVRDASRKRNCPLPDGALLCTDMRELVDDPEIHVVVELMGGLDAAEVLIRSALEAGKHVVTANKALLAERGAPLFRLAAEKGLYLRFEASVCGGIPIVQTLRQSMAGNRITSLSGILNGTSNYVLSAMTGSGASFASALKQAQELGFAEADPTLDIEGIDAAHKLALLIRLAWGVNFPFEAIPVTGISGIKPEDIQYAREFGYNIKLLGQAEYLDGRLAAAVAPALVPKTYLLAKVGHSYNAVRLEGNAVGSLFLHGLGAGALPTGSAVAADLLDIARGEITNNLGYVSAELPEADIIPSHERLSQYYVRLSVYDTPGVLRDVAAVMADHHISVAQVLQKGEKKIVPLIFMTHAASAEDMAAGLVDLEQTGVLHEAPVHYRVLPDPNVFE